MYVASPARARRSASTDTITPSLPKGQPMSAEPIAEAVTPAESAEKGLLIAMLLLVLMGVGAMLFMI